MLQKSVSSGGSHLVWKIWKTEVQNHFEIYIQINSFLKVGQQKLCYGFQNIANWMAF